MASVREDPPLRYAIAAWVIAACLLVATLQLRLLPALLAGLLVYELVHVIAPRIPSATYTIGFTSTAYFITGTTSSPRHG